LALAVEELAEGVANVDGLDRAGIQVRVLEGAVDDLGYEIGHLETLTQQIPGEV
jgi:hypothetical protein